MSAFTLDALPRRADPGAVAISSPEGSLTYAELERDIAHAAGALRELGVEPGDRVAVWAPKSPRTVTMLYAVMRAGAAYVPIDPISPPLRARRVIEDAGCRVLCADEKRACEGVPLLPVDRDLPPADPLHEPASCESDLAYVLYTSGSTGRPKGVMLTHRNALAFVEWTVERFGVGPGDRVSSHAPFHFDLSIFDLYGASLAGASLHLLGPGEEGLGASMAKAIRRERISVWYSVPSALTMLAGAAAPEQLESLRVVLFAGEVFPVKHLRRLRELAPGATLANLYGPTETNVCTYHVVPDELPPGDRPLPIGRPCENQEVFALDDELRPVPEGEVGELWVRGPTVMRGYWGDPELTAARLRQNPLHDLFPDPAYRTGDLVRRLPGGEHEFLGRRDHQVKSRGYRIELGEIEAALTSHPAVGEAAVVAVPDDAIGNRLVAYVAAGEPLQAMELKRHCAQALPRYMVPGEVVVEEALPHTSTGKIDRQALGARAEV
ncbi:MAG: amino acid adenylation domain-containing protein [Actinomycetota bacterium]|nr:amino acid adenylation domain-containing protein [Actinomycetota bacterium]